MSTAPAPIKHKAVYPGTFDPVTTGHLDIVERACKINDHLVIAIAKGTSKKPLFDLDERVALIQDALGGIETGDCKIEVMGFDSLLIEFCRAQRAAKIIRGVRAVSDFEYEFQLATMNHRLASEIETVFLTASERQQFIASSLIKEISKLGGDVSTFVAPNVLAALEKKFGR